MLWKRKRKNVTKILFQPQEKWFLTWFFASSSLFSSSSPPSAWFLAATILTMMMINYYEDTILIIICRSTISPLFSSLQTILILCLPFSIMNEIVILFFFFFSSLLVLPHESPHILATKSKYQIGDLVNVTCISAKSKPAATLRWFINDEPVSWTIL